MSIYNLDPRDREFDGELFHLAAKRLKLVTVVGQVAFFTGFLGFGIGAGLGLY